MLFRRINPISQRPLTSVSYSRNMSLYSNQGAPKRRSGPPEPQRQGHHKLALFLVTLILVFVGAHVLWSKHVSAEVAASHQQQLQIAAENTRKAATFAQEVNELIAANPAITFSVATITATDGLQQYGVTTTAFDGASTGKLLTAADYLHHVETGSATLRQQIEGDTAEDLLDKMVVNSDDTAWADLNDYLGNDDLSNYAATINFTNYDPDANTFTAGDVAQLLHKLYSKQLLNPADTSLLLGYLKQANYRTYIVPAVPSSDTVYHKVGLDVDNVHDAAIITNGNQSIVLVIFTDGNGTYDWENRATLMQTITADALTAYL